MDLRHTIGVATALLLLLPQVRAAETDNPVARPQVKAGDRWVYRRMDYWKTAPTGNYELRVTFTNDKSILAVATEQGGKEADASYTVEWNAIVSALDQAIASPDTGLLRFPLRRGERYTSSFQLESTKPGGEFGARMVEGVSTATFSYSTKVVGWEEVAVPAGRFRALRIDAEGQFHRRQGSWSGGSGSATVRGFARVTIWYAPEARRWVKYTYDDSVSRFGALLSPNERVGEELVEYKLQ